MAGISAWRVNDVVAYDLMRESAIVLTAQLLQSTHRGSSEPDFARADAARLRHDVLTLDGYDRAAVAALATQISDHIRELSGESS